MVVAVSDLSVVVLGFVVMFGLFPVGDGGFACMESGGCVIGLFRFRVVKRKRTPCDVPKIKMKKSNTGL